MPSVLLVVFTVQLLLNIISTVGAPKVNDLVSAMAPSLSMRL